MSDSKKLSEKEIALRKELSDRTINVISRANEGRYLANDPAYVEEAGKEISKLIHEERLEQAQERLNKELAKHPEEIGFLNLQMILNVLNKQFGGYVHAKKIGSQIMEMAVEKSNIYYAMVAINNLGLIAHNEGHDEFSKVMYLAAHLIDRKALGPMRNIAGWYARRGKLENAQLWIERILEAYPDWQERNDIVTFLKKDESLYNLRSFKPYKDKILSKI